MRRFRFGLQKVLKLRQYKEQETKNELGKAIGILTAIENEIKANAVKLSNALHERFESMKTDENITITIDETAAATGVVPEIASWDNYIRRLEQQGERLVEQAARAELFVEEKRNLYLEASRELKVMEKLKEKRQQEYRKEMFAADTKEQDDRHRITIDN